MVGSSSKIGLSPSLGCITRYMPGFEAIGISIEAPISTHFGLQVYKEVSLLREYVSKVSVAEFLQNSPSACMKGLLMGSLINRFICSAAAKVGCLPPKSPCPRSFVFPSTGTLCRFR